MKRNGVNQPEHYYMHCKCNRFLKKMLALACAKVTTKNMEVQTNIKSNKNQDLLDGQITATSADRNWWTLSINLWMFSIDVNSGKPPMSFIKSLLKEKHVSSKR